MDSNEFTLNSVSHVKNATVTENNADSGFAATAAGNGNMIHQPPKETTPNDNGSESILSCSIASNVNVPLISSSQLNIITMDNNGDGILQDLSNSIISASSSTSLSLRCSQIRASVCSFFDSSSIHTISNPNYILNECDGATPNSNDSSASHIRTLQSKDSHCQNNTTDLQSNGGERCAISSSYEEVNHSKSTSLLGTNISHHELDSFLNVGRHLIQSSAIDAPSHSAFIDDATSTFRLEHDESKYTNAVTSDNVVSNSSTEWYSNFTEKDWENFHKVAKQVLNVVEPELKDDIDIDIDVDNKNESNGRITNQLYRRIHVPIIEPNNSEVNDDEKQCSSSDTQNERIKAITSILFPSEFVCPLCSNLIVGSVVLDCCCTQSTFCLQCLEESQKKQESQVSAEDDGFVMIDWKNIDSEKNDMDEKKKDSCPSCHVEIKHGIPCHSLDIAILNAVKSLKDDNAKIKKTSEDGKVICAEEIYSFQAMYYNSLRKWREEIFRRRSAELDIKQQLMLSKIISEQESILKELNRRKCAKHSLKEKIIPKRGDVPLLMAAIIGINVFIFRKRVF